MTLPKTPGAGRRTGAVDGPGVSPIPRRRLDGVVPTALATVVHDAAVAVLRSDDAPPGQHIVDLQAK